MKNLPELSVVILCYRSNEKVVSFAKEVQTLVSSLTPDYEIILVGNYIEGSRDTTEAIVREIAGKDENYKAVCKPKRGMMGWDMKEGLKVTIGNYICVIDGDSQFPIENIGKCYRKIKGSSFDLVKTYRTKRGDGIYRRIISLVYNYLFSILFPNIDSRDINSKPKIFTRQVYEKMELTSDDWFIDAEIMLNIKKLNACFCEVPTHFRELEGRSSFIRFSSIFEFIRNMIFFKLKRW